MTPNEFYTKSNLKENPFRSNPVYDADPRMDIWVGYDKQRTQLVKYLTRSRCDQVGNANFIMLLGHYGVGKSHALLWARHQIMHSKKDEFDALCYLVPTMKKDKGKMTFAGAFSEDIVGRCGLADHLLEFRNFLGTSVLRYRDANGIGSQVKDDEVIDRLGFPSELAAFAKRIYHCEVRTEVEAIIMPKGLSDYQATTIFAHVVNLFVHGLKINDEVRRFKKAVYLMIDELDELLNVPVKEVREVNLTLRHIYDWCPNCFGLVVALSAEGAIVSAVFEQYLLQRIQRQIEMQELGKDEAMNFVEQILRDSRIDEEDAVKSGFFPFDEAAVEAIMSQLHQITPRKIVNTMQEVVEEVRLAGLDPDTETVDLAFLDENDVMGEVLGDGGLG